MLTKSEIKYYASLLKKKSRLEERKFLIEGKRIVEEGLKSSYKCETVIISFHFNEANPEYVESLNNRGFNLQVLNSKDFEKLCDTDNPQGIAAVFEIPDAHKNSSSFDLSVALEDIADPGNAGTIIRTCDWFGIKNVIFSENSVDLYNSKVIRSSMGSIFHVNTKQSLDFLSDIQEMKKEGYSIICADMKGENIFNFRPKKPSVVIFSSEANGPSDAILKLSDKVISIPRFGNAESLNVATASAVVISELVRH
ncbi:MAG: RNA methyltransferase [Bacteroidota bacterium]|nr:RNA methyltransferase [Bacteroidota bacterium]MDP4191566.1 RNA methyltransferase [Bacteroidota bacterium]MDP4196194.1 RNA methyltransferase [Bacteroidota bacterium]